MVAEPAEPASFAATTPGAQQMLEELRGQPGFGVVVAASSMQGSGPVSPSIGERLANELEALARRERQVSEIKDLASHRVVDLNADQLRRILEFAL